MKKTSRQSTTSTIGVMLMCGSSSAWWRAVSIGGETPGSQRGGTDRKPSMNPGLVPGGVLAGRGQGRAAIVGRGRADGLGADQVDDPPRLLVEVTDQDVHLVEQEVIGGDRDDRDPQAEGGRDQGQADPLRQQLAPVRADLAADRLERLDQADARAERAERGGERRGAVEPRDVALEVGALARRIVPDRLADRRGRLSPVADD